MENTRSLTCKRCLHTKYATKYACSSFHSNVVIYKKWTWHENVLTLPLTLDQASLHFLVVEVEANNAIGCHYAPLTLRVRLSTSLRYPYPPLTLTQKGHRLPADDETRVAPHYFCLLHKFMLLLLWTEKVKYCLILKKTQAANNNKAYRSTFLLVHYCWTACCSADWK